MEVLEKVLEESQRHKNKNLVTKGDIRALQLYLSYRYGKPKESIDLNSSEGLNINFKDLIKFVD